MSFSSDPIGVAAYDGTADGASGGSSTVTGSASLSSTSTLTVAGVASELAAASLSSSSTMTVGASVTAAGTVVVALSSSSSLSVTGSVVDVGKVALTSSSSLTVGVSVKDFVGATYNGATYGGSSYNGANATNATASDSRSRSGVTVPGLVISTTATGSRARRAVGPLVNLLADDGTQNTLWSPVDTYSGPGNPDPGYYVWDYFYYYNYGSSYQQYATRLVSDAPDKLVFDFLAPAAQYNYYTGSYDYATMWFLFECDATGQGPGFFVDSHPTTNHTGFSSAVGWVPSTPVAGGLPAITLSIWHTAVIDLVNGTATVTIDNVSYGSYPYTPRGHYIAFVGGKNYTTTYLYIDNILAKRSVLATQTQGLALGHRSRVGRLRSSTLALSSASGLRGHQGRALAQVVGTTSGGGGVPPPGVTPPPGVVPRSASRWRLDDPVTGAWYIFEMNPNDGGSPTRKRALAQVATTAADGAPLVFEGDEEVWSTTVKGVARSKVALEALVEWTHKNYTVLLTDDLGRVQQIYIEQFVPQRASLSHSPYRHEYTLTYRVLGYGAAPIIVDPGATGVMV